MLQYSFDLEGNVLATYELGASVFAIDNEPVSPGAFVSPTNGQENGLAKFIDKNSNIEFMFGEPVTRTPEAADFIQWQEDLSSGKVPDFFETESPYQPVIPISICFYKRKVFYSNTI